MISYLLLFIGLLLIFVEFFLPGGLLGIAGGIALLTAIVLFALQATSLTAVLLFILLVAALTTATIIFVLRYIRKRGAKGGIYLDTDQEGYTGATFDKTLIGKKGKAISDLKPSGHILVEGKRLQAVSKTGYIYKEEQITVIGGEGGHLIVTHGKEK